MCGAASPRRRRNALKPALRAGVRRQRQERQALRPLLGCEREQLRADERGDGITIGFVDLAGGTRERAVDRLRKRREDVVALEVRGELDVHRTGGWAERAERRQEEE